MEETKVLFEKYLELLDSKNYAELKKEINEDNEVDIAEFFEEIPVEKQLFVFRLLNKDLAAEVFSYMDSDTQEHIVKSITDSEVRNIVDEMFLDDTVDFLSEAPANLVTKVLRNTDENTRKKINEFLNYPENSAGSIMTIEFVQFSEKITVKEAMAQLRKTGTYKETIYTCYVINSSRVLVGVLHLKDLIVASDDKIIGDLAEDDFISVSTMDDQEDISNLFKRYNLIAMPVVDKEQRLVGIITVDDIVDVIDQENTEDFEKMSALLPSDEEYLKTSVFELSKNRIVWLMVLMISGTISGIIISKYEEVLSSVVILATFVPLLMDTGGNAGSQVSTLIIRGMALGEIEMKDILKVLWKELRVGILCGTALSIVNFIRLYIIGNRNFSVNLTVSLSILFVVVFAKAIGCLLPMGAKKLNLDPAIMAGPLITTVVDSMALIIYFQFASIFILNK